MVESDKEYRIVHHITQHISAKTKKLMKNAENSLVLNNQWESGVVEINKAVTKNQIADMRRKNT